MQFLIEMCYDFLLLEQSFIIKLIVFGLLLK